MLWNASKIQGYAISASDGRIGNISDFLFDDTNWLMRWLVVDTGHWLSGRKVLLPSSALAHLDAEQEECAINLTKQQIKDSPDVDTARSVTREMESTIYGHYGYTPFWDSGFGYAGGYEYMGGLGYLGGIGGAMPISAETRREQERADARQSHDDVHLRSVATVTGYHIHAIDGLIGHIKDFLLEDTDWSFRYLVADTKNWWPGKKVLISPRSVKGIIWDDRLVNVNITRQKIKDAPTYDASVTVNQAYEEEFRAHYHIDRPDT